MQNLDHLSRIMFKGGNILGELNKDEYIHKLIDKYSDMLIRITFLHMKNRSDAEDIVQDVFMKLVENPRLFENSDHEKAWLIRVTINLCKDRLKMAWFRKRIKLEENCYSTSTKKSNVLSAVMELPTKYRSIILLFYFESYSIKEIAKIIGVREGTVGSQLHRARKILEITLKEDFEL